MTSASGLHRHTSTRTLVHMHIRMSESTYNALTHTCMGESTHTHMGENTHT